MMIYPKLEDVRRELVMRHAGQEVKMRLSELGVNVEVEVRGDKLVIAKPSGVVMVDLKGEDFISQGWFRVSDFYRVRQEQTPLEDAVREVREALIEKGTVDIGDIEAAARKYGIPVDRLIREALRGFNVERIDKTYRLKVPAAQLSNILRETFGVILSPEEVEAVDPETGKKDFPEKLERAVLHIYAKLPPECREAIESRNAKYDPERRVVIDRKTGKVIPGCYNPYAVARATLRRKYGLPVRQEQEVEAWVSIISPFKVVYKVVEKAPEGRRKAYYVYDAMFARYSEATEEEKRLAEEKEFEPITSWERVWEIRKRAYEIVPWGHWEPA